MNEPINDGGTVIETSGGKTDFKLWSLDSDISLRDWFAGQALNGMVAACADKTYHLSLIEQAQKHETPVALHAARLAYETADAMLKAREQQ